MTEEPRVWVEDRSWRLVSALLHKRCRFRGCHNRAVAEIDRLRKGQPGNWWACCEQHLYGRRLEGVRVLIAVHPDSPAAKRGHVWTRGAP